MKYPCDLIRDIMPLYHDEVASEESRKAVEEHFCECQKCKAYYAVMCEADVVETNAFDEETEKKAAASYESVHKKVIKRIGKIIGITALTVIGVILAIYIVVIAYLKFSAEATWEEHHDISEYGMLDNGENMIDKFALYENSIAGPMYIDNIWPETITENMDVQDYLLIYYCPFDSNYLSYLVVKYDETDYEAEITHLAEYPSTDYVGRYGAEGFEKYELLAMQASDDTFVYALTDGENTIIYVGMQFPGYSMDIEYEEYIPEEYLPRGLDLSEDNPTRQKVIEIFGESK